jgi:hypothetical protein
MGLQRRPSLHRYAIKDLYVTIEVSLLLCDAANADSTGKVHMLGAGWAVVSTPLAPHAVVAIIRAPSSVSGQALELRFQLLDADGEPVSVNVGSARIGLTALAGVTFGEHRHEGLSAFPLTASFALNVGPLDLKEGFYRWRLTIGDSTWDAPFAVITAQEATPAGGRA